MNGFRPGDFGNHIRVDQGLDTTEISPESTIDADLLETQYIVEMDNRFGSLVQGGAIPTPAKVSFVDDDNIASYYLSLGSDPNFVGQPVATAAETNIQGPRGTNLAFKIQASTELQTSPYLFEQLGSTRTMIKLGGGTQNVRYIDTTIKITGATTGYSINLPIRYIRNI
jgi:hypothetical protein